MHPCRCPLKLQLGGLSTPAQGHICEHTLHTRTSKAGPTAGVIIGPTGLGAPGSSGTTHKNQMPHYCSLVIELVNRHLPAPSLASSSM